MATITKRKVKGHVYYYLVEGKRVDGKSRLVKQQYLGRAEQVVARLEGQPPEPTRVRVAEYGGSQALLSMARRLRLVEIIDAVAPKRDQGLSVGTYILLAVLNRVLAPAAKPHGTSGSGTLHCTTIFLFGKETCEAGGFGTTWAT